MLQIMSVNRRGADGATRSECKDCNEEVLEEQDRLGIPNDRESRYGRIVSQMSEMWRPDLKALFGEGCSAEIPSCMGTFADSLAM